MTHAVPSPAYREMGKKLIEEMTELTMLRTSQIEIEYLVSDQAKMKSKTERLYAEVELVPDKYRWGIAQDVTITVYFPNVQEFTEEQRRILIFQQLLKIVVDYNVDNDTEKYSLRDPDVNDFAVIINRYGINWKQPKDLFSEDD